MNPTTTWLILVSIWVFLWVRLRTTERDAGMPLLFAAMALLAWLVLVPLIRSARSRAAVAPAPLTLVERFLDEETTASAPQANAGSSSRAQTGEFDAARYLEHYQDLRALEWTVEQARQHYAENGIREGRTAFLVGVAQGGLWNDDGYLDLHPDAKRSAMAARDHYRLFGWKEGRRISLWIAAPPAAAAAPVAARSVLEDTSLLETPIEPGTLFHATLHPPHALLWQSDGGGSFTSVGGGFVSGDARPFRLAKEVYSLTLWVRRGQIPGSVCKIEYDRGRAPWEIRATSTGFAITGAEVDVPAGPEDWIHLTFVRKANGDGEIYRQGTLLTRIRELPSGASVYGWTLLGPDNSLAEVKEEGARRPAVARVALHKVVLSPVQILEDYLATARRFGPMGDPERRSPREHLLMDLNAGIPASYPGQGPVWYDLRWFDGKSSSLVPVFTVGGSGAAAGASGATATLLASALAAGGGVQSTAMVAGMGAPSLSPYRDLSRTVVDKVLALSAA